MWINFCILSSLTVIPYFSSLILLSCDFRVTSFISHAIDYCVFLLKNYVFTVQDGRWVVPYLYHVELLLSVIFRSLQLRYAQFFFTWLSWEPEYSTCVVLSFQAWNPEGRSSKVWRAVRTKNFQSTIGGAEKGCSWGNGKSKETVFSMAFIKICSLKMFLVLHVGYCAFWSSLSS